MSAIEDFLRHLNAVPTTILGSLPSTIGRPVSPVPGDTGWPWFEKEDYDYGGFKDKYGENAAPKGPLRAHYTDEFKLPNHATFSNESRYSNPLIQGGKWNMDNKTFQPSGWNVQTNGLNAIVEYLRRADPDFNVSFR